MSFSKTNYRNRRKQGLRGQGDKIKGKFTPKDGEHMVRGPKGFKMVNRKTARQRVSARWYEDEDDKVGHKFTRKGSPHPKRIWPSDQRNAGVGQYRDYEGPKYDPSVSNHERVFRSRIKSGRIKVNQGDK